MRIISGERKGMQLQGPPKSSKTRPTEDKLKEAIFNIIQPIKKGAICLDLFAGTGQVGIEFLSRGAACSIFSEKSKKMVNILRDNIEKAGYTDQSQILIGDFRKNIAQSPVRFDYVYIDPPFHFGLEEKAISTLARLRKLKEGALVIVESGIDEDFAEDIEGFVLDFKRDYKSQTVRMYREKI